MKDDVDKMKHKIKSILIPFVLLATLFLVTACSGDPTAYENNDAAGYTVSVKYDANGGVFTGTSSVMVDCFNIADMAKDSSGNVNLKLLDPAKKDRGDFTITNGNLILAGWYKERTESTNSNGEVVYSYSGKFDFETDVVTVDSSKTYTSAEPVLTLYAVWIPKFEIEFVSADTKEPIGKKYEYNPETVKEILAPAWNMETGAMDMSCFPRVDGKTFEAAYYDEACTQPVGQYVEHPGEIDDATGEAKNTSLKLYVKYTEGEWFHIYTAEQFTKNAKLGGHYIIHNDLDFADTYWPSNLTTGQFKGSIQSADGQNVTFKNIELIQKNINNNQMGLFGTLTDVAKISNVTFENVTLSIEAGTRTGNARFGLLAGTVNAGAQLENVQFTNGKIVISSKCYWGSDDVALGLICGVGFEQCTSLADIDLSGIVCEGTGDKPITFEIDGNTVTFQVGTAS